MKLLELAEMDKPVKYESSDWMRGRYVPMSKLGEGGFGKVRMAVHLATNDYVAIKEMEKKKLGVSFVLSYSFSSFLKIPNLLFSF